MARDAEYYREQLAKAKQNLAALDDLTHTKPGDIKLLRIFYKKLIKKYAHLLKVGDIQVKGAQTL